MMSAGKSPYSTALAMADRRQSLARRERQVLDAVFRLHSASVAEIVEEMPEDVSYSAVRAALRTLREKELVTHRSEGRRYVYSPAISEEKAGHRALAHVVRTFFDGSPEAAAATLLGMSDVDLSEEARARLEALIRDADRQGR